MKGPFNQLSGLIDLDIGLSAIDTMGVKPGNALHGRQLSI